MMLWPLLFLTSAFASPADVDCYHPENYHAFDFVKQIQKGIVQDLFRKDPNAFCDLEMAKRTFADMPDANGNAVTNQQLIDASLHGNLSSLITKAVRGAVGDGPDQISESRYLSSISDRGGWLAAFYPAEDLRYDLYLTTNGDHAYLQQECAPAQRFMQGPLPYDAGRLAGNEKKAEAACAELLGVISARRCLSSFEKIDQEMAGSKDFFYGLPPMVRVLGNARYDRGLRIAAETFSRKAETKDTSGDLFSDLEASFRAAGENGANAREMAWNTVGLLAMSGANLKRRLDTLSVFVPFSRQKAASLDILAMALPVLDHRGARNGKLYSWPAGVSGACNTSKSYHFWGAAFLARQAAYAGGDPQAAAVAAFQAEKVYDLKVREQVAHSVGIPGTNPGRVNAPAAQIMRADLAYAAAGAVFGANDAGNRAVKLNVDNGIAALLRDELDGASLFDPVLKKMGGDEAAAYLDWKANMAPNSAYNAFASLGFPKKMAPTEADVDKNLDKRVCGQVVETPK